MIFIVIRGHLHDGSTTILHAHFIQGTKFICLHLIIHDVDQELSGIDPTTRKQP